MHKIAQRSWSESIFKAYDIRGRYPEEINEDACYKIARAFARYLRLGSVGGRMLKIVISADARVSSPALKEAFTDGLLDEGVEIIDAGLTTTPMHYFVVNKIGADGGAMITASHVPPPVNGIKLLKAKAISISGGAGMEEIKNDAIRGIFTAAPRQGEGSAEGGNRGKVMKEDYLNDYIQFLISNFPLLASNHLSLVACAGNGMTSILLRKLFSNFPNIKVKFLHDDLDMTFPNHEADPLKEENLKDVQREVRSSLPAGKAEKRDAGMSFDGDGDRVGFVDEKGNIVRGDIVTALLAQKYARPGEKIVYDLRSSRAIKEEIEERGGKAIESRVGYAFIKTIMRNENAAFGGELSEHYYFRDFFFTDAAIFAALSILDTMRSEGKSLSELTRPLMRYYKTEEINFEVTDKEKVLDKVASHFSDGKISYLDGIKIDYPNWWFNLRLSNTEDLVRLNLEAKTAALLDEKKKLIEELLK